jgi:adenylate cyclase
MRIAMHCGPVVAGELGVLRREIAFSGETVNTTARIETFAKDADREIVVSRDVLDLLRLPCDLSAEPLGRVSLSGREQPLELQKRTRSPAATCGRTEAAAS